MSTEKTYEFKAEIKQLLHLLAFSLYKNKEIFLRELISNASDALSKLKYLSLTDSESIADKDERLEIEIEIDKDKKIIKVIDTGIGMTDEELINNIGTIAKSGTSEFLKLIEKSNAKDIENIGQFGVGFYSAFIVADKVQIRTKSYKNDSKAYEWESDGTGSFTLKEVEKDKRGTEVILFLKDGDDEKEFLEKYRVENIIKKYSNFIPFPILVEKGQVNKVEALWLKPKSSIKEEEYNGFFKLIGHSSDEPLFYEHIVADAPYQYRALLYCPKNNFEIQGFQNPDYGLSLYTSKVLIEQECKDLIPKFLRFIKGVVDSSDVPLNVSRESIQNNRIVIKLRTLITKRILARLSDMLKNTKDKYLSFYKVYKNFLKEGVVEEFSNRDKIADLLMFHSSKTEKDGYITLEEYISRMYPDQKDIFFITGKDLESVENSPYIEIFKKKNIEVLYLFDPIDEVVLNNLNEYKEKKFKSVEQENLDSVKDIKTDEDAKVEEPEETKEDMKLVNGLVKYMKDVLKDLVKDVVLSKRLIDSPYILVHSEEGMSTQVEKLMKMMNKEYKGVKKTLEINPHSPFIKNLAQLYSKDKKSALVKNVCSQIFDNAKILEGSIENPLTTINRLNNIMEEAVKIVNN